MPNQAVAFSPVQSDAVLLLEVCAAGVPSGVMWSSLKTGRTLPVVAWIENSPHTSSSLNAVAEPSRRISKYGVIALVPMRNVVLFPHMLMPISVGRVKSIAALMHAMQSNSPFGVVLQNPGSSGAIRNLAPVIAAAKERGALAKMKEMQASIRPAPASAPRRHSLAPQRPLLRHSRLAAAVGLNCGGRTGR